MADERRHVETSRPTPDLDQSRRTGEGATPLEAAGDQAATDPGTETELWTGRTHWKHYAGRLALWVLGNIVAAILLIWIGAHAEWLTTGRAFWIIMPILLISGLLILGRVLIRILGHRYRVTSQRLFIERGIFSRTIDQTELIRVDDVRVYKTFLDRLFGLGSVAVVSTDATDRETVMEGIFEPDRVAEAIRSHMRSMRRKSLFVENL